MIKKVSLTNIHTGRKSVTLVDTGTDEKALIGSGKTQVETAEISDVKGMDETIQRFSAKRNSLDDRVALFNGLAKCFDRNIPIIKSFHLQANRVRTPRFRGIIADVSHDLTQGEKISDAMQKKGDVFPPDIIALIRAGEESGRLPEIFRRLGNSQKKTSRIINKLKSGMIYPAVVTCLGLVVVIVMSFTLVPAMSSLYASLNTELPLATRGMMAFSNILLKATMDRSPPHYRHSRVFQKLGTNLANSFGSDFFPETARNLGTRPQIGLRRWIPYPRSPHRSERAAHHRT